MSTRARSRQASIAALPVSPEVAPSTVMRFVALGQHVVEQAPYQLQGEVLEGERGPWNSSRTQKSLSS